MNKKRRKESKSFIIHIYSIGWIGRNFFHFYLGLGSYYIGNFLRKAMGFEKKNSSKNSFCFKLS
jgi:hypothetical protein